MDVYIIRPWIGVAIAFTLPFILRHKFTKFRYLNQLKVFEGNNFASEKDSKSLLNFDSRREKCIK